MVPIRKEKTIYGGLEGEQEAERVLREKNSLHIMR